MDANAARRALAACDATDTTIERTILEFGLVPEEVVFRLLAQYLGLPFFDISDTDPKLLSSVGLPREFLERVEAVPVSEGDSGLVIATADPRADDTLQSIGYHLKARVVPAIAAPSTIKSLLGTLSHDNTQNEEYAASSDVERLEALANEGPIIKLVNDLVASAVAARASDIHIEAEESGARVRLRIDGALNTERHLREDLRNAVVSRLKVMANLNISEKRRPQDGRADMSVRGRNVDIRLSTLPTMYGESVVLRLLDRSQVQLDWHSLGFSPEQARDIVQLVNEPNGIFLVAGPTGSGKTTTLYTAIEAINLSDRKIVTVEDPVEYTLPGINQVQVAPEIDMTFASALRAILRQDPNVVMVGEIRDEETAEIAVRAALVGRLVLSTVHTNSSVAAIDRLRDLGLPSYLIAATLRGVLSQRLVRQVCTDCNGAGCETCDQSGVYGRAVISELLQITPSIGEAISCGHPASKIADQATDEGFKDMSDDARQGLSEARFNEGEIRKALGLEWSL
ncbi:MAG: GspE/PulE family protein [Tateyamaria sp.]|uniref:GspE/PulE family protein n=1 Tax=Tateyamaria sp. TaxID=1929288 RepID=UPI00329FF125